MQNFTKLNHDTIHIPRGIFGGITRQDCYPTGELKGIRLAEKNVVLTHAGELIPSYTETPRRKTKYSVQFYENGNIKAVALDEVQEITTPIGEFPAELVTFYETGELNRFFPLDGQISGMWSESDEKALSLPLNFEFPFAKFSAIINGIALYKTGDVRSITLFPGEVITVETSVGEISVRNGFSLYRSGELRSLEPDAPVEVQTPIKGIIAYDPEAIGINADSNSLKFDKQGRVTSLVTVHNKIGTQTPDGQLLMFSPKERINPTDGETTITTGLRISFDYENGTVIFDDFEPLSVEDCVFVVADYDVEKDVYCSPHECTGCGRH